MTLKFANIKMKFDIKNIFNSLVFFVWLLFLSVPSKLNYFYVASFFLLICGLFCNLSNVKFIPIKKFKWYFLLILNCIIIQSIYFDAFDNFFLYDFLPKFIFSLFFLFIFSDSLRSLSLNYILICLAIFNLLHIFYFGYDIYLNLTNFKFSDTYYFLNELPSLPRVGRRHLSFILVFLIITWLNFYKLKNIYIHLFANFFLFVDIFILVLLDTRGGYVVLILSLIAIKLFNLFKIKYYIHVAFNRKLFIMLLLIYVCIILMTISIVSKGRMSKVFDTVNYTLHEKYNNVNITNKPDVEQIPSTEKFWEKPKDDTACIREHQLRCSLDQSIYLRFARLIDGGVILSNFKYGIGYRKEFHNSLNENVLEIDNKKFNFGGLGENYLFMLTISFGIQAAVLYFINFVMAIVIFKKSCEKFKRKNIIFLILFMMIFIRSTFDGMDNGLIYLSIISFGIIVSYDSKKV
jgi:hypothetical protein